MTTDEWIKLRLPTGTTFSRNGVTITIDDAVTAALDDYSEHVAGAQQRYALADLLEIVAANVLSDGEREGDYDAGNKASTLRIRIDDLRSQADSIAGGNSGGDSGGIRMVDANFNTLCCDENKRCP